MDNILDNPAWNALISGNKELSFGDEEVRYFNKEVSPFAAFDVNKADRFQKLYELIPHQGPVLFVSPTELDIPAPWKISQMIEGLQMVCNISPGEESGKAKLIPLTEKNLPRMIELAKLTNPGPFGSQTIKFGHYQGIFDQDKLVAMAGQRLHAFNYAEISAVCTDPEYIGKGFARQLLVYHINRIRAASEIPFLHVKADNERAIKLYEYLGFSVRKPVYFYVVMKPGAAKSMVHL
jgi:ribosomal protein S18 acetylase RimI-like enzyme